MSGPIQTQVLTINGIPKASEAGQVLAFDTSDTTSVRSFTTLKVLGSGSFHNVYLCDWHGDLPRSYPFDPLISGLNRPQWANMKLVAIKQCNQTFDSWDTCKELREIQICQAIRPHLNVVTVYDAFFDPNLKRLSIVCEAMEGNLYHLIKARKGRPLADGLLISIGRQLAEGIQHLHSQGFFHRDIKPENILITTLGHHEYRSIPDGTVLHRDVIARLKLGDFGLARRIDSEGPYTEYVNTRWYRAPEVLLLSKEYTFAVDMWAYGTVMAELVTLQPLFPGRDQIDQISRIQKVLGDPARDEAEGGGPWPHGIHLASQVGFTFPSVEPIVFSSLFLHSTPASLVALLKGILRWDPEARLDVKACLEHPYFVDAPVEDITVLNVPATV